MTTEIAQHGRPVEQKLRQAWRRERRFHALRGVCHLLLWAAGLGLADFVVDWLFHLPGYGRTALLVLDIATLAVVFYRSWWRHLERYDPVKIALQVERRHPDLRSLLVSYVQFSDGRKVSEHMSAQLIQASRRLAVEATQPIDFREIVNWKDLRRVGLFCLCVVLACGGLSVRWTDFARTLLVRLVGASVEYPTRTRIVDIGGPVTVPEGASVTLWARADGLIPRSGTLTIRPPEGEWERLSMLQAQGDDRKFEYHFEQIMRGFTYKVRLGDAVSQAFEVRTIPAPHVTKTRVRLQYPKYTHLKDKEVDSLHLEVPEGTKVLVDLECDRALKAAEVVKEQGAAEPMKLSDGGRAASIAWDVKESFPFHFRWTESEHGFRYDSDVTYFVRVTVDVPPEVEIIAPTEDDKATVQKKLAIRYRAADDYGISKATVIYSLNGGAEQARPIGAFDKATVEEEAVWALRESIPALKEGDALTFAVEVADNREGGGGPQVVRSRPIRLDIVSIVDYLRYMAEKRAKLIKEVQALHEEETDASKEVKTLEDSPIPPAGKPEEGAKK